jgi:hypothetical protein
LLTAPDHQQRSFPRAKLHIRYQSHDRTTIHDLASHQVADVGRARLQLRALGGGNLQLHPRQSFRLADVLDARKLQYHVSLVEPVFLKLQFASAAIPCQSRKRVAFGKSLGKTRVQLRRNFAAPALRAQHACDGDKAGYSTISNW